MSCFYSPSPHPCLQALSKLEGAGLSPPTLTPLPTNQAVVEILKQELCRPGIDPIDGNLTEQRGYRKRQQVVRNQIMARSTSILFPASYFRVMLTYVCSIGGTAGEYGEGRRRGLDCHGLLDDWAYQTCGGVLCWLGSYCHPLSTPPSYCTGK